MIQLFFLLMAIWGVKGVSQPVDDISLVNNKTTLLTTPRNVLLKENAASLSTATENISVDVNNILLDNKTTLSTTLRSVLLNENTTSISNTTEKILVNVSTTFSTTSVTDILFDDNTFSSTIPSNLLLDENFNLSTTTRKKIFHDNILLSSSTPTEGNTSSYDDREFLSATTENNLTLSSTTVENISSTISSNTTIDNSSMIINLLSTSEESSEPNNYTEPLETSPKSIKPNDTTLMPSTTVKDSLLDDHKTLSTTSKSLLLNSNRKPSSTMKNILLNESTPSPSISPENNLIDENTKLSVSNLKTILLNGYKTLNPPSPVTNLNIGTVNLFLNNNITLASPNLKDIISFGGNMIPLSNVKNTYPNDNLPTDVQKCISPKDNQKLVSTIKKSISVDNDVIPRYITPPSLPFPTLKNHSKKFDVYWNVPTFMCHRYGLNFEEVSKEFGMIQNPNDTFRGDKIVILYDPGAFPALVQTRNGSKVRNNRVPQKGNIQEHLDAFKKTINEQVDPNFSGLGVIDFEHWRPVFQQNWAKLDHNRNYSYEIEKEEFPALEEKVIKRLAAQKFEIFGQLFMEETIKLAKKLRPKASWGYYAFPYCFNSNPKNRDNIQCTEQVMRDNDNIQWLWDQKDVLLPSIYLPFNLNYDQTVGLVNGRLNEARRIANKYNPQPKILPYFWYKYHYLGDTFVKYGDLERVFQEIMIQNVDGFILWGSSNDLNSKEKCLKFYVYLNNIFGPLVKKMIDNDSELTNEIISNEIIGK